MRSDRFEAKRSITVLNAFAPFVRTMLQDVEGVSPSLSVIPMAVFSLGSNKGCDSPEFKRLMGRVAVIAGAPGVYGDAIPELPPADSGRTNWMPFVVNCIATLEEVNLTPHVVEECLCREELFSRYGDQELYWRVADGYLENGPDVDTISLVGKFAESQSDLCKFDGTGFKLPPELERRRQEIPSGM